MRMASPFIELEVGSATVKVTNPDKVLFPDAGHTKRDLVDYYLSVGEGIVRALRERPTQLRRFPDGIEGEQIYQKRVPEKRPEWVEVARVTFPSGRHADELCVTEVAQVIWGANLAVIDFHPWPSRRAGHRAPGRAADRRRPAARDDFADGKRVAAIVREVLAEIGYTGWPKTSGNRGIHVAVPDRAALGVPRRPSLRARLRARDRAPRARLVTTAWWKEERGEKVFIDYNQNARDRTIASAYSVRAAARRDRLGAGHLGRAARRRDRGLHARDDAGALREARRRPGGDRRHRLRPARPARVGRARGGGGRRRGAVPAELPEDAGRAAARAALAARRSRDVG